MCQPRAQSLWAGTPGPSRFPGFQPCAPCLSLHTPSLSTPHDRLLFVLNLHEAAGPSPDAQPAPPQVAASPCTPHRSHPPFPFRGHETTEYRLPLVGLCVLSRVQLEVYNVGLVHTLPASTRSLVGTCHHTRLENLCAAERLSEVKCGITDCRRHAVRESPGLTDFVTGGLRRGTLIPASDTQSVPCVCELRFGFGLLGSEYMRSWAICPSLTLLYPLQLPTSLQMAGFRSLWWRSPVPLRVPHPCLIHPSARHSGCSRILATADNAAVNAGADVFLNRRVCFLWVNIQ